MTTFCRRLRNKSSELAARWASFASHLSDMAARSSNMAARWGCSKEATALNATMGGSDFYMLVSRPTLGESKWQPKGQGRAGSTLGRGVVLEYSYSAYRGPGALLPHMPMPPIWPLAYPTCLNCATHLSNTRSLPPGPCQAARSALLPHYEPYGLFGSEHPHRAAILDDFIGVAGKGGPPIRHFG